MSRVVLDASALLALLNQEPGAQLLTPELLRNATASTVNLAEVQTKLVREGGDPDEAWELALAPISEPEPFTTEHARIAGTLVTQTRALGLSLGDRSKLVGAPPASIQEFKTRVHQLLIQKSKKKNIYEEASFDPAYHVRDPDLIEAARLGKAALRDQRIMAMLWNKFKNQNEIALFLGVNRSSVNRRCKEFNLS